MLPGRVPDSSAIEEPHSGQKCLSIGLPLSPMLLNVLSVPSIVTASLVARTSAAKALPVNFLAIPAMAHRRARRVGLGCVPHRTAEAAAFDLHLDPLALLPFRPKTERVLPIHRALAKAKTNLVVSRTERSRLDR
jgi:hypothetical protein